MADGLVPNHPKGNSPGAEKVSVALNKQTNPATAGPMKSKTVIIIYIGRGIDQRVNNTWMVISIKILPVDAALSLEKLS